MSLSGLHVDGLDFKNGAGHIVKLAEVSDFCLPRRWFMPSGPTALITPRLAEWKQIAHEGGYDGPITLRCFRHAAAWNQFQLDPHTTPDYYSQTKGIRAFLEFCGDKGFYVELTGGDAQEIFPSSDPNEADPSAFQQHLNDVCASIVDVPNVIFEELNERWKNGNAYSVVSPQWGNLNPLVRASGFYGENNDTWTTNLNRDYITYHGTRAIDTLRWPKTVWDMPAQATALHSRFGRAVSLNEPWRFQEDSDPEWAARIGLMIAFCASVTFHSQRGRDGDGFAGAPVQRAAAVRYFAGIAGGLKAAGVSA